MSHQGSDDKYLRNLGGDNNRFLYCVLDSLVHSFDINMDSFHKMDFTLQGSRFSLKHELI